MHWKLFGSKASNSRDYPGICFARLKKTMKDLSHIVTSTIAYSAERKAKVVSIFN
jgi:hypothetical protein